MPRSPKQYVDVCAEGRGATVICTGGRSMQVRGSIGAWVVATQFNVYGDIIGFASGQIGRDGLLPDTWYRAHNGKLVEV